MKRYIVTIISLSIAILFLSYNTASAYWVWTPETKKFINPKNAVKDSPKEQFDWGMNFYNAKDYERAAAEFDKLTKQYEYSEYASKAQYYMGLCYENMGKFYIAFQNYQKAIENFPHIENLDEIVAREFNIAKLYAAKSSPKVLGTDILTSRDRAIEIYKKVVDNAPYGKLADEAQYEMGSALKQSGMYDEAIQAFQKILDDYPNSRFEDKARFEVADCAYKASLKPAYDVEPTDKAIKAFEEFSQANRDTGLNAEADKTIQRLKDKAAEKSILTARFYESQNHPESAIIYYKDVLNKYPTSSFAKEARDKIERLTERIKNPPSKTFFKIAAPAPKREAAKVAKKEERKGWSPFGLWGPGKQKAAPVAKPAARESRSWLPFGWGRKPAVKAETEKAASEKIEPVERDAAPEEAAEEAAEAVPMPAEGQEAKVSEPVPQQMEPAKRQEVAAQMAESMERAKAAEAREREDSESASNDELASRPIKESPEDYTEY